jgi:hypothetical protein
VTPREPRRGPARRTLVDRAPAPRRTALLGLMVVALTLAVLTLAGTTPRGIGARVQNFERVELEHRTFSCPGGIPGATAAHGNLDDGLAAPAPVGDATTTFEDDKAVALGAFAGQESRTKHGLAWLPCPEPRARWWFVGAGAATVTHDTVLSINNPRSGQAVVDVALNGTTRQVDAARANDRFFGNNVSMGLYPEMVARREERGRQYPRWKARLYAAYGTLQKYPHVTVTLESEHHQMAVRTHVLMVSNNTYDLSRIGIQAPRGTLEEGRLSVYWLPHLRRIALMRFLAHYLAGRVREAPGFRSFRTSRMKVHASKQHLRVGVDGELFTFDMPLVITIAPRSLLVKVVSASSPAGGAASRRPL